MKTTNVLVLGMVIFAGCSPINPPPDTSSFAKDSAVSDSAIATTSVFVDANGQGGEVLTVGDAVGDLAPKADIQVDVSVDLAADVFEVPPADLPPPPNACASNIPVDLAVFVPTPGSYTAVPDPPVLDGAADPIYPLSHLGFTVVVDSSTGAFSVRYAADGWAYHMIPVIDGAFSYANGQGLEGWGGTNCPTDGFGICGAFVSPTEARGNYTLLFRCQRGNSGNFIATLVK
jgi:hypothetical protein